MRPLRFSCSRLAVVFAATLPATPFASAHPGHDHSNIPALIRHPLADAQHTAMTLGLLVGVVAGVAFLVRARRSSLRHGPDSRPARVR